MNAHTLVEKRENALWITLNRPSAKNALTPEMVRGIDAALTTAEGDLSVRVVVLVGSGDAFCAGVDLKAMDASLDPQQAIRAFMDIATPVFRRIEAFPLPVIAAVHGHAMAGGLELLLCCDLVVADGSARIGDGHANVGVVPGGGGSVRLTQRMGALRAREFMFTGDMERGERLLMLGLVNQLAEEGGLTEAVDRLIARLSVKSPEGLSCMKRMVLNALSLSPDQAFAMEEELCIEHTGSADAAEGFSAFAERRRPDFRRR